MTDAPRVLLEGDGLTLGLVVHGYLYPVAGGTESDDMLDVAGTVEAGAYRGEQPLVMFASAFEWLLVDLRRAAEELRLEDLDTNLSLELIRAEGGEWELAGSLRGGFLIGLEFKEIGVAGDALGKLERQVAEVVRRFPPRFDHFRHPQREG